MSQHQRYVDRFSIDGDRSLLGEEHLGVFNGMLTTNVLFSDVLSFRGLFAPPFVSSNFLFEIRLFGEKVRTNKYTWYPFEAVRFGNIHGVEIMSELVLIDQARTAIIVFTIENKAARPLLIPLQFNIEGGLDVNETWDFKQPQTETPCRNAADGIFLLKSNDAGVICITTDAGKPVWEEFSSHWESEISLPAGTTRAFHAIVSIGRLPEARREHARIAENHQEAIANTRSAWENKVCDLFEKLPTLHAQDQRLEKFYNRSLLHLLINQWNVPEFKLHPYYSTGSMNGGCVCCYLWDFGNNWKIFHLYDPAALREHVKAFLSIDLTRHFAFLPISGEAYGPWYYINQEKIIFHIYYYVLFTGDIGFLKEEVNGRTIIDHVVEQALVGDDLNQPAVLVDYGSGGHHLELRKEERYDNYLPDMNVRRGAYYFAAQELCDLAGWNTGKRSVDLRKRAQALKELVRQEMWSPEHKWFFWLDEKRTKHLRYTIQMFKLFDNPILDRDQEEGLLSHWNEDEFLSAYGIHSMSKKDPAYDQVDIDNGGGGCCSCFVGPIMEKLYLAGHGNKAEDLLQRILWWGERLPYWSDSIVANKMDYRRDTPLQNAIGAVSAAQSIIFGMFGVNVDSKGSITINPAPPPFSPEISLTGLKLRGCCIDIHVKGKNYTVKANNQTTTSIIGNAVILRPPKKPSPGQT